MQIASLWENSIAYSMNFSMFLPKLLGVGSSLFPAYRSLLDDKTSLLVLIDLLCLLKIKLNQ